MKRSSAATDFKPAEKFWFKYKFVIEFEYQFDYLLLSIFPFSLLVQQINLPLYLMYILIYLCRQIPASICSAMGFKKARDQSKWLKKFSTW